MYLIFVYYCFKVLFQKCFTPEIVNVDKHWLVYKETSSWADRDLYYCSLFPLFLNHFPLRSFNQKHVFYFFFWIVTWNYDDSPSKKSSNIKTWIRWMLPRCLFPNSWRFRLFFPVTVISHKQHLKHCWHFHVIEVKLAD